MEPPRRQGRQGKKSGREAKKTRRQQDRRKRVPGIAFIPLVLWTPLLSLAPRRLLCTGDIVMAFPNDLRQRLRQYGQEHVLAWWDRLGEDERRGLVAQLNALDLDELAALF